MDIPPIPRRDGVTRFVWELMFIKGREKVNGKI
jgi:hypothetical protein